MEHILDIGDPKTGKTYHLKIDEKKFAALMERKIGETINGELLGFPGYKFEIRGGSDDAGFPMMPGVKGTARKKILLSGGVGYRPKDKGIRRRKTVRGSTIAHDIRQVNLKIVQWGSKPIISQTEGKGEKEGGK